MDLKLSGLKVIITGASKGLGFSTANALYDEGAYVMINSRNIDHLKQARNKIVGDDNESKKCLIFAGDVTEESVCKNIAEKTNDIFDGIDILITNSGGPPAGSFEDLESSQWDQAIDLSFKSHLNLIKYCLPYLKQSQNPSVLAVTSITVKYPLDNLILSNTIRTATAALIKSLSFEMGEFDIRFNSILPGWTMTDRVKHLLSIKAEKSNSTISEEAGKISSAIPLNRMGKPEEFARTAAFIVSPAASYINGVLLSVDGGITRGLL